MVWVHPNKLHILNATQSKTRKLPPELLSTIFQHTCPTPDIFDIEHIPIPTPFHLTLRLVSTLWYDVTQSTPQLWTSVFLPTLYLEDIDIRAQYLKLCLNNSGDLPLTLSLRFDPESLQADWYISPVVDATLLHNAHRIRALRLLQPHRCWPKKLIPKMCQLAAMRISSHRPLLNWSKRLDERLFFPNTANMKRIVMDCPCLVDFRLECTMASVTHVELTECPIDFVIELLLRCPNLVDFHCHTSAPPSKAKDPRSMITSPLILSHLSTFTWSNSRILPRSLNWHTVLYEYIHFPALTRFNWVSGPRSFVNNTAHWLPLFKFPKSVSTLELGWVGLDSIEEILNHFSPLAGVTQLRLFKCHYRFVEQAFSLLSQGTDESNTLFPKLTSIKIGPNH
ncbi:hypothetical protein Agabi119p4_7023 [Agaricus bisporus var. burnettii]|uniref:F-box domain-containing protein n=1 Tax=Agaricus bisporus var. burnettii TaxID=192524 RepID=A0A8H7KFW8_AGABI|nr:hypothetical protein Agabi119p4_7023 [Agaricus bisporus var. burnettii]